MKNTNMYYSFLSQKDIVSLGNKYVSNIVPTWLTNMKELLRGIKKGYYNESFLLDYDNKKCLCIGAIDKKTNEWKRFMIYDLNCKCISRGNLRTIANMLGIDIAMNYKNVKNIEDKPELFLEIYKGFVELMPEKFLEPQKLADVFYDTAIKNGNPLAQIILRKSENVILKVCKAEKITRSELAKEIGVSRAVLENCINRETVSKSVYEKLKSRYDYI